MNNQNDKPTGEYCSLYPPAVNPEYYINSGIFDHLKASGITIRYTHSLEEMKRQHETLWNEYLQHYKDQSEKHGNHVEEADIPMVRLEYLKSEFNLFTGFLAESKAVHDKIEIQKHLIDLKKEIERQADGKQKAGVKSFSWTGSKAQLEALCQALIKAGYIHPDTTNEAFTVIFTGQPIDNSLNRVTWIKKAQKSKAIAKSAVIALFDLLANADKIPMVETRNRAELFRKLETCFCDEAGNPLKFEHKHTSHSKENADLLQQIISSL